MKILNYLSLGILLLSLFSCSKEQTSINIVGKWQLREIYNGYQNGGDFKWSEIPDQYRTTIEFHRDGTFTEEGTASRNTDLCAGNYILSDNHLSMQSNCLRFSGESSLDVSTITFSYPVKEGEIREKYVRVP